MDSGCVDLRRKVEGDAAKEILEPGNTRLTAFVRRAEHRIGGRRRQEPAGGSGVVPLQRVVEPANGLARCTLIVALAAGSETYQAGECDDGRANSGLQGHMPSVSMREFREQLLEGGDE